MHNIIWHQLGIATWQSIYMIFISSFLSIFFGLIVGVFLFTLRQGQVLENRVLYGVIGFIVNVTRSVPFIILMISIIPFTRLIVGTSIGTNAAIVSLTIAAIPFFARIAEASVSEVLPGLVEAANAMGASPWQVVYKVLVPEALPSLVKGATLTIIALTGYSAMAGAVGGGGLGELAINYGYQQFNVWVMLETVVLLVVLVQLIQWAGDIIAKSRRLKSVFVLCVALWVISVASQIWPSSIPENQIVKLGVMSGISENLMKVAQQVALKRYGLHVKLVPFDDYILPNTALNSGDIDANLFQTVPYLNAQIKMRGYKLTPIAKTFVYPFGFYSRKIKSINDLPNGAIVAIPNDPSNEGRALRLLAIHGFIKLKPGVGLLGTPEDIISNPRNLQFKLLSAAQLPRVLQDATLVGLNNDFLKPAGFKANQALLKEGPNAPYANIIVVQTKNISRPIFKKLIAAVHSKAVLKATLKAFPDGEAVPAYKAD